MKPRDDGATTGRATGSRTILSEREDAKRLVIAFFEPGTEGMAAARSLAEQSRLSGEALRVAILAPDDAGRPDVTEFHAPGPDDPERVGAVLQVIASMVRSGIVPTQHHFFDAESELTTDDISRIGAELEADHAAVAVLERRREAERAVISLTELGGKTEIHRLSRRALQQVAASPPIAS
jgi:hypothetical protein